MKILLHATEFCLRKGQGLRIIDGGGHKIDCRSGCMWITQDGDTADVLLEKNESLTLAKNNTVYISAIRHATFGVEVAEQRRAQFALEAIRSAFRAIFANAIQRCSAGKGERS